MWQLFPWKICNLQEFFNVYFALDFEFKPKNNFGAVQMSFMLKKKWNHQISITGSVCNHLLSNAGTEPDYLSRLLFIYLLF